jgi:hypothetical protein
VQFRYYTEKTPSQCMLALNERLQARGARLEGWVEKNGRFSLAVSTTVMRRFKRTTRLSGVVERADGLTVIEGAVSDGADPRNRRFIYGALIVIGIVLVATKAFLPGLLLLASPLLLNIPLQGDYENSKTLTGEVQRTLKARSSLPAALKKAAPKKGAADKKPAVRKPPSTIAYRE